MVVGFIPTIIILLLGTTIGMIAGYIGGRTDNILMRLTDVIYAFPDLLFVIRPDGVLVPSLDGETPALSDGGTCVVLTAPDLATERSTRVHTGQQVASADATARFEAGGSAGGSSRAED